MIRLLIVTTMSITLRAFLLPFGKHFRAQGGQVDGTARGVSRYKERLNAFNQVWGIDWLRNPLDPRNLPIAPRQIREVVARERGQVRDTSD